MFTLPLTLPTGKKVRIPEVTNKAMFTIIKHSQINDFDGLVKFIDDILFSKIDASLNIVEKFYILLYMRIIGLGSEITINTKENSFVKNTSLNLFTIIEKLELLPKIKEDVIIVNNFTIRLGLPSKLHFASQDDIVFDCFKSIKFGDDEVNVSLLPDSERDKLYENLDPTITSHFITYLNNISQILGELIVIPKNDMLGIEEVKVAPISNAPIMLIAQLFNQDIKSFFEFMYHFVNKIGGSVEDFFALTYSDCKIILDFYVDEVEKQNEEAKAIKR